MSDPGFHNTARATIIKEMYPEAVFSSTLTSGSSLSERKNKRKRRRICEHPSLQQPVSARQTKLDSDEGTLLAQENLDVIGCPGNTLPQYYGVSKNGVKLRRVGTAGVEKLLRNSGLAEEPVSVSRAMIDGKQPELFDDFSKEVEGAISRIEALIPSLQKLVIAGHQLNENSCRNSSSPCIRYSVADTDTSVSDLPAARKYKISKQFNQLQENCNNQAVSPFYVRDVVQKPIGVERYSQAPSVVKKIELAKSLQAERIQVTPFANSIGSIRQDLSRNRSASSQSMENIWGQNVTSGGERDVTSRRVSGQTNASSFRRGNKETDRAESDYNRRQSRTGGGRREAGPRKGSLVKYHDSMSEEKRCSSSGSSSGTSFAEGTSGSSPSRQTYQTSSTGCTENNKKERQSESTSDNDSLLNSYNHGDDHSDESRLSWSTGSSNKWDHHTERGGKGGGRYTRVKKKLGMIFRHHHHHHHHHHYHHDHDSEGSAVGYAHRFLKRLGAMFLHTRESGGEKPRKEKSKRSMIKRGPNKKAKGGHFRALFDGLIRHVKHSKQPKDGIQNLRKRSRHWNKKTTRLGGWHKLGARGGVKVSRKGRVKLGIMSKRFPVSTAKLILKH